MKTLVVGGTGPTGPAIVAGLAARGHDITICHTGSHELPEVDGYRHIHTDVRDHDALASTIGSEAWDAAIVTYGRLRTIAEVLRCLCTKWVITVRSGCRRSSTPRSRSSRPGVISGHGLPARCRTLRETEKIRAG